MSSSVQSAQTSTAVSTGVGISASVSVSLMTVTSPQAAFSIVNQLQLLLILPLIGTFMTNNVLLFIEGMDFASFNFGFMSPTKISYVEEKILDVTEAHDDEYLKKIGIEFKSTLFNQISLFQVVLLLITLHFIIFFSIS